MKKFCMLREALRINGYQYFFIQALIIVAEVTKSFGLKARNCPESTKTLDNSTNTSSFQYVGVLISFKEA